jgi:peptidoglycan/LPS O-acetylase OafA/YrhL
MRMVAGRSWLLDTFKGLGCLLIVVHHLAFYGPMADVVAKGWPDLMQWLADHGRLAVQVFLVCGGYLSASSLARLGPLAGRRCLDLSVRRYWRLAIPLLAALSLTVLVSEWLRPWFNHDSLSPAPEIGQALAHVFFVQHLWGMDGLSAGVWYAAVDLQLYVSALLLAWFAPYAQTRWPRLSSQTWSCIFWFALVSASLWWWNRQSDLDDLNVYFLGAYGLGWLACSMRQAHRPWRGAAALVLLGGVAWWLEPRWQVATACSVAVCLTLAPAAWLEAQEDAVGPLRGAMAWLSRVSYSVFVVHFAVSLVVNATVARWWPADGMANALGMLLALALSVLAGAWLYERVEKPAATAGRWLFWASVFMASSMLAMGLNGRL